MGVEGIVFPCLMGRQVGGRASATPWLSRQVNDVADRGTLREGRVCLLVRRKLAGRACLRFPCRLTNATAALRQIPAGVERRHYPHRSSVLRRSDDVGIRGLCARRDSNPHARRHQDLNLGRLPIPPLALCRAHSTDLSADSRMRRPSLSVSRRQSTPSAVRRRLTCPVARTLYWANVTVPSGATTTVERMTPV